MNVKRKNFSKNGALKKKILSNFFTENAETGLCFRGFCAKKRILLTWNTEHCWRRRLLPAWKCHFKSQSLKNPEIFLIFPFSSHIIRISSQDCVKCSSRAKTPQLRFHSRVAPTWDCFDSAYMTEWDVQSCKFLQLWSSSNLRFNSNAFLIHDL